MVTGECSARGEARLAEMVQLEDNAHRVKMHVVQLQNNYYDQYTGQRQESKATMKGLFCTGCRLKTVPAKQIEMLDSLVYTVCTSGAATPLHCTNHF